MSRFAEPGSRLLPDSSTRVLVAGIAGSGAAAARVLERAGAVLTIIDDRDDDTTRTQAAHFSSARVLLGGMDPALAAEHDVIVASPGIPPHSPLLVAAQESKTPVWSEIELAWRISTAPIIGVTGTNGKTTTTMMVHAILERAGRSAVAAGNIGFPLSDAASSGAEVIVAELSSFQLHSIVSFHVPVGVLLNIADDHLDWHGDRAAYAAAKARLFERQTIGDVAVTFDDPQCRTIAESAGRQTPFSTQAPSSDGGAGIDDGWIVVPQGRVVRVEELAVTNEVMVVNAVAAAAAACAFGVDPSDAAAALRTFVPGSHRLEHVAVIDGVTYINDSKATNPHATVAALRGLARVILIAGGRNKGLDLGPIAGTPAVIAVVAIGESASLVEAAFAPRDIPVERAATMHDAVQSAASLAKAGDTILLSPACASQDMFIDYQERGDIYRAAVMTLHNEGGTR